MMKKYCCFLTLVLVLAMTTIAGAAYLRNVPQTITQPDGTVIQCFASGDEYYNWLHDDQGYVILQDQEGWFKYGVKQNGVVVPSSVTVDRADPASAGLEPGIMPDPGTINRGLSPAAHRGVLDMPKPAPTTGTINNIVIFIKFADDSDFADDLSIYDDMFNSSLSGDNSMYNYYKEVSYDQLMISTTMYPSSNTEGGETGDGESESSGGCFVGSSGGKNVRPAYSGAVKYYKDSHNRSYYQPYSSTNTDGYNGDDERTVREHTLLENAVLAVRSEIPSSLNVDGDGDGRVDNICFIVQGSPDGWNSLLWPHMWSLYTKNVTINGKQVYTFNFQLETALSSSGVGVLCHEMFHSLGAPDLYHYPSMTSNSMEPVGYWDLMERDQNPPQHMGCYMKMRYGKWISSIPTLTTGDNKTLNPLTSSSGQCYKVSSTSGSQYYVLEYRRKTGTFESSIPDSGLIVYRINTNYDGDGNADGNDEVYIYRPNGTSTSTGDISDANFTSDEGRPVIDSTTNPAPLLADFTTDGGLDIDDIGSAGTTINFDLNP